MPQTREWKLPPGTQTATRGGRHRTGKHKRKREARCFSLPLPHWKFILTPGRKPSQPLMTSFSRGAWPGGNPIRGSTGERSRLYPHASRRGPGDVHVRRPPAGAPRFAHVMVPPHSPKGIRAVGNADGEERKHGFGRTVRATVIHMTGASSVPPFSGHHPAVGRIAGRCVIFVSDGGQNSPPAVPRNEKGSPPCGSDPCRRKKTARAIRRRVVEVGAREVRRRGT